MKKPKREKFKFVIRGLPFKTADQSEYIIPAFEVYGKRGDYVFCFIKRFLYIKCENLSPSLINVGDVVLAEGNYIKYPDKKEKRFKTWDEIYDIESIEKTGDNLEKAVKMANDHILKEESKA